LTLWLIGSWRNASKRNRRLRFSLTKWWPCTISCGLSWARIHSDANLTAAARGVLRGLDRIGPQTVPQMARARPVSRQYIQAVVNQLGKRGLVELVPNPAHKRSSLVQLTSKGKKLAEAVAQKEKTFLAELQIDLSEKELLLASSVLRKLRDCFLQILRDGTAGEGLK